RPDPLGAMRRDATLLAALFAVAIDSQATTFCVHTTTELNNALADVSTLGTDNGKDNIIQIATGLFSTGGVRFTYATAAAHALTIEGGYDDSCTHQDLTPGATQLDGAATDQALNVQANGTITIRHVTIQNGSHNGSAGGGAQVYLSDAATVFVFENNQVIDNHTTYATGGITVYGTAAGVHINANLFAGNT